MNFFVYALTIILATCFYSCNQRQPFINHALPYSNPDISNISNISKSDTSVFEKYLISKNLINIHDIDSSIRVCLHYSTNQNFLHKPIYQNIEHCYLPCDVASKLNNAQQFLHHYFPDYNLIVFDAVRPLSVQKQMWNELKMPFEQKINYLAHPNDISLHNYGAAVDVGIIGKNDVLLDMGSPFDFFGELSEPKKEQVLLREGKLSKNALANRLLLRKVMLMAGFTYITSEWWHFNATTKEIAKTKFELIE